MGFPRQEYWSELPFLSPGDLPDPGVEPGSPAWQVVLYRLSHRETLLGCNCVTRITCVTGRVLLTALLRISASVFPRILRLRFSPL